MPCMPYGCIVVFPALLAFFAATLTFGFGFGCGMISFNWGTQITYFGPWTAQLVEYEGTSFDDAMDTATVYYSTACYLYNDFSLGPSIKAQFDAPAKTAQAFSMMAIVLAIPLAVVTCLPCCLVLPQAKKIYRITAFVCVFTMFSSFMTLIMRQSDLCKDCEYGWSAWTCISAGLLWLFTAVGLFFLPDTPEDDEYPEAAKPADEGEKEDGEVAPPANQGEKEADGE